MNKWLGLAIVTFAISGLIVPSVISDSLAGTENKGRDEGEKNANGCEKGKGKAADAGHNPNCGNGDTVDCTYNSDGDITATELSTALGITETQASLMIHLAETNADSTHSNTIDSDLELNELNIIIAGTFPVACV